MTNQFKKEAVECRVSSDVFLPLELTHKDLHICLWDEKGKYKWTVGYFDFDKEGPWFKFVGDRPLDERVNWVNFQKLIKLGYALAWHKFDVDLMSISLNKKKQVEHGVYS